MTVHSHVGYDDATEYEHEHTDATDGHDHSHIHDQYTASHHHAPFIENGIVVPDHDHDAENKGEPTDCGHPGDDVGTVRTRIIHRGKSWWLCGPCGAKFDWPS